MSPVPATRVRAQTRCSVLVEGRVGGTRGALGGCAIQGPPRRGPGGNLVLRGGGSGAHSCFGTLSRQNAEGPVPPPLRACDPGLSGLCGSGRLLLSRPWAREPDPLAFCVDAMCLPPRSGHSRRPRSVLDAGQTLRVFAAPRNQASGPGSREERCQPAVICEEEIGFADIVKIPLSRHMLGSLLKPAPSSA